MRRVLFVKNKNKFKAVKTRIIFNGEWIWTASKLEAAVGGMIELMRRGGLVKDLRYQHRVDLPGGISWKIDFSYFDVKKNRTIVIEAKGAETAEFKIKLKLYQEFGDFELQVWKGTWKRPVLTKTILPKKTQETENEN